LHHSIKGAIKHISDPPPDENTGESPE